MEEGWAYILNEGILKVEAFVNNRTPGSAELSIFSILNRTQYMEVYVKAYDMCLQRAPYNWSAPLYERHETYIKGYLEGTVLPALQGKNHGYAPLLAELAKRWVNHKFMTKCLDGFFRYLNKYYAPYHNVLAIGKVGIYLFKNMVFTPLKDSIVRALHQSVRENTMSAQNLELSMDMVKEMGEFTKPLQDLILQFRRQVSPCPVVLSKRARVCVCV